MADNHGTYESYSYSSSSYYSNINGKEEGKAHINEKIDHNGQVEERNRDEVLSPNGEIKIK